jgi:CBS domain-containing protein
MRMKPRAQTVADAMITAPKLCQRSTSAADLRDFLEDEHVHAALIVDGDVLITVVLRTDLTAATPGTAAATGLGQLRDRVIHGSEPLDDANQRMLTAGLRRLAVIDNYGRLLGLLCLNRSHTGFCTQRDVQARTDELSSGASTLD